MGSEYWRIIRLLKKWIPRFVKGLIFFPDYCRHYGFFRGPMRLGWLFFAHGLGGVRHEMWRALAVRGLTSPVTLDYIVEAPDFVPNSAGIYSLYKLCHDLNALGFSAAVSGSLRASPTLNTPLLTPKAARRLAKKKSTWVIYPEIVLGNPLKAHNVVRWVLNRPGLLGGECIYDSKELVFVYSSIYTPYVQNRIVGKLYLPTMDRSIFFWPEGEQVRNLICYYVGKSKFKKGFVDKESALEITRDFPTKKDLGRLLRISKVLYSFDNSTALIHEAIACGCVVVVVPDGTQKWEDYEKLELGRHGIMWGKWDPDFVLDRTVLEKKVTQLELDYSHQLHTLIDQTQREKSLEIMPAVAPSMKANSGVATQTELHQS